MVIMFKGYHKIKGPKAIESVSLYKAEEKTMIHIYID